MKVKLMICALGLLVGGCGLELPEDTEALLEQEGEFADEDEELSEEDAYLLGDDEEYEKEESEEGEGELDGGDVIEALRALKDEVRADVAECVGIAAEMAAFEALKSDLIAGGADFKTVKDSLKEEHAAMKALLEANKEAFWECKEASRDSEAGLQIKEIMHSCWEKPEFDEDAELEADGEKTEFGLHKDGKKRHGKKFKKRRGHKLPPREFAVFDSVECIAAVEAVEIDEEYLEDDDEGLDEEGEDDDEDDEEVDEEDSDNDDEDDDVADDVDAEE